MAFSKSSNFGKLLLVVIALTSVLDLVSSQDEDMVCPDEPGPDEYFYPHPDCSKYYVCQHGNLTEVRECSIGLYFNPRLNECDFPDAVPECVGGTRPPPGSTTAPTTLPPTTEEVTNEVPSTTEDSTSSPAPTTTTTTTTTESPSTVDPSEWIVIQRRGAELESGELRQLFNLSWVSYESFFGDPAKDFWIGLREIARLTQNGGYELRIDMRNVRGLTFFAQYDNFQIDEADNYRLNISGFSGNTHDSMSYHNGIKFSTYDRDNDEWFSDCSGYYGNSGWWYKACYLANLNGIFYEGEVTTSSSIRWNTLAAEVFLNLVFVEMKIRPRA